jgi:CyaY protein
LRQHERALLAAAGQGHRDDRGGHAQHAEAHRYTVLALQHLFILSAMTATFVPTELSDAQYHAATSDVLAGIEATVDRLLQDDVIDIDASRTGGLLELSFPNGSKVVINTQPPLHELWLAARSGGFHFKPFAGCWRDTRDGRDFFEVLSACATEQAGRPLVFSA